MLGLGIPFRQSFGIAYPDVALGVFIKGVDDVSGQDFFSLEVVGTQVYTSYSVIRSYIKVVVTGIQKTAYPFIFFGGSIEFRVIYRLSCLQVIIEKSGSHGGYPESFVLVFNQIIHALDTVSILVCQILQIAALSCFLIQSA